MSQREIPGVPVDKKSREESLVSTPARIETGNPVINPTTDARAKARELKNQISYGPSDEFLKKNVEKISALRVSAEANLRDTSDKNALFSALDRPTPANVRVLQDILVRRLIDEALAGVIRPKSTGLNRYDGQFGENVLKAIEEWINSIPEARKLADVPQLRSSGAALGVQLNAPEPRRVPPVEVVTAPVEIGPKKGQQYTFTGMTELRVGGKMISPSQVIEFQGVGTGGVWIGFKDKSGIYTELLIDKEVFDSAFKKSENQVPSQTVTPVVTPKGTMDSQAAPTVADQLSTIRVLPGSQNRARLRLNSSN